MVVEVVVRSTVTTLGAAVGSAASPDQTVLVLFNSQSTG